MGSHQCCAAERRGSALGWLCTAGDHVTEGDTDRELVSLRPQGTKGVLKIPPGHSQSSLVWTFLRVWDRIYCWTFLMFGYCIQILKEELNSRDILVFLPKCVCLCVRAHACVWTCIYMSFSFKHSSAPEQRLQRLPPAAALTWHWPSNKQRYDLLLGPALVWEREMKRGLIWPIVWTGVLSQKAQILLGLWCLCWHKGLNIGYD